MTNDYDHDDTDMTLKDFEERIGSALAVEVHTSPSSWREAQFGAVDPFRTGIYTVSEVCRILRPGMTPRKVHYWLDEGLVGKPVSWGGPGYPTLLSFEQVLKIRVLHRIRKDLKFSLTKAHDTLLWITDKLVSEEGWRELRFFRASKNTVGVSDGPTTLTVPSGQRVIEAMIPELGPYVQSVRQQWMEGVVRITDFDFIVSDPALMAGSPVIEGTRIETSFIANLAQEEPLAEIIDLFPKVDVAAIREAARFEGVELIERIA